MKIEAEIEVADAMYKHAKFLRTSTKNDPHKAKAAADWEIKFHDELEKLKSMAAQLPGMNHQEAA